MNPSRPTQIAKITRPALAQVYPRQRLFRWLDKARRRYPILWIQAPPGAGKTTLIASYLAAREPSALWYQIDEGDADFASFFYYLGLASRQAAPRRRHRALGPLTPEYLRGLPAFTRNFFREFFARLERPGVLVLDNYQDVPPAAPIHDLLPVGLSEIPAGVSIMVMSRVAPPAGFARLRASNQVALLPWADLRLTPQEGARIAALYQGARSPLSAHALRVLHEKSDGWVAGLVLLLQEELESHAADHGPQPNHQTLFDYFAAEVFLQTDAVTQSVLMKSSVMPKMSVALVEKLTEAAHAGSILHDLNQKNYFTYRLRTAEPVYEYHPLFREFLRARARETFPPDEMQQITGRAARLQESAGDFESAVSLYAEAQDWAEMVRLILARAPGLIAEGRHQTLAQWIQLLPESLTGTDPWLLYWRGVAVQAQDLLTARACYADAYRGFCGQDAPLGAFMAWSAIENTFHYFLSDFAPLTPWIDELQALRTRYPEYPSLTIEASVTAAMFGALMWRAPSHPEISWWAERAEAMLAEDDAAVAPRVQGGNYLIVYHVWWRGDLAAAARVLALVEPLVSSGEVVPLLKLSWYTMQGHYLAASGQQQHCLRVVQEGFQLAAQTGVHVVDHQLCVAGVHGSLFAGDLAGAGDYLRRFGEGLRPGAFFDVAHYHHVATWLALAKGDFAAARTHCATAVEYATLCGADHALAVAKLTLAHLQAETGDHAAALSNLADVLCWTTKADSKNMRFHSFLSRAHVLLNMKDEAGALAALREGLAVGRAEGYVAHAWWIGFCRDVMARLCAKALEAGIETTYVQTLVRRLRLAPERPPWHVDTWPWPIRVHTLGHFAVLKDGAPLHFAGKAQKKPLELLRALIALDGQGVNTAELAEILWPDADGDMAAHACETTLYRLRKLLGEDGCLTLHDGLLSLNPAYCWLDVWAFEQALERAEIQRALSLYRGPFLGRDGAPWALPLRDRLRSKFLRAVLQQGKALAESNQWEAAIEGYLKGLETDPLAEELYRHLMLAYRKLDRFAEALAVYRRCQTALTSLLGAEPAPQTQALWREIRTAWQ